MKIYRFNQYFEGYLDRGKKSYTVAKTSWVDYRDDIEYILTNAGDDYPYKVQSGGKRESEKSLGDGLGTIDKRNAIKKMYDYLTGKKDNKYVFFEFENTDDNNERFISVMSEVLNRIKHYHKNDLTIAFLGEEEEDRWLPSWPDQPFLYAPPTVSWASSQSNTLEEQLDETNWDNFGKITRCKFSISNAISKTIPKGSYVYGASFNHRNSIQD